jgi:hypothetical protein
MFSLYPSDIHAGRNAFLANAKPKVNGTQSPRASPD